MNTNYVMIGFIIGNSMVQKLLWLQILQNI